MSALPVLPNWFKEVSWAVYEDMLHRRGVFISVPPSNFELWLREQGDAGLLDLFRRKGPFSLMPQATYERWLREQAEAGRLSPEQVRRDYLRFMSRTRDYESDDEKLAESVWLDRFRYQYLNSVLAKTQRPDGTYGSDPDAPRLSFRRPVAKDLVRHLRESGDLSADYKVEVEHGDFQLLAQHDTGRVQLKREITAMYRPDTIIRCYFRLRGPGFIDSADPDWLRLDFDSRVPRTVPELRERVSGDLRLLHLVQEAYLEKLGQP